MPITATSRSRSTTDGAWNLVAQAAPPVWGSQANRLSYGRSFVLPTSLWIPLNPARRTSHKFRDDEDHQDRTDTLGHADFPLTPTLTLRARAFIQTQILKSDASSHHPAPFAFPSPWGEGQGEGDRGFQPAQPFHPFPTTAVKVKLRVSLRRSRRFTDWINYSG